MLPWKTIITIDRQSVNAVYLQIIETIIREIKHGVIPPGTKMPGTRSMASQLGVNRQTIVKVYEELYAQEWLVAIRSKGTFVNEKLPIIQPKKLIDEELDGYAEQTGYTFGINDNIHDPADPKRHINGFHDGPDVRLVPVDILSRGYKRILQRRTNRALLSYVEVQGRPSAREAFSTYLNTTRGLHTTHENVMLTRGSSMALFLLSKVLIHPGDGVIVAQIGYRYAHLTFMHAGANIIGIDVDEFGLSVPDIERICQTQRIRAVYVTSHHHYPTTVTLCAPRRMELLQLAEKYKFVIIEDDYDYEFHYESSPILPLASADSQGMVVYIGSLSKTLAPALRLGYLVAPPNLIHEVAKLRQIIDVQGDPVMEQTVAEMIKDGEINRHMNKALKEYRIRRDFMCDYLDKHLSDVITFKKPEGGLAIWAQFDPKYPLPEIATELRKKNWIISNGRIYDASAQQRLNSTRMGFGWMNVEEAGEALEALREVQTNMI